MQIALIVSVAVNFVVVLAAAGVIDHVRVGGVRREQREQERQTRIRETREDELLNRLAHAHDRPYDTPPIDEPDLEPDDEELDEILRFESSFVREGETADLSV